MLVIDSYFYVIMLLVKYLVCLNVEMNKKEGGKSWLKKGVSDLQGQATAWVSSWRQDTCVAWHLTLF